MKLLVILFGLPLLPASVSWAIANGDFEGAATGSWTSLYVSAADFFGSRPGGSGRICYFPASEITIRASGRMRWEQLVESLGWVTRTPLMTISLEPPLSKRMAV